MHRWCIGSWHGKNSTLREGGSVIKPHATHAAYQLENGNWVSKLGDFEDIEHFKAEILHGPQYGIIIRYMSRPRQPRPSPPTY
jgi:hypothetical protein